MDSQILLFTFTPDMTSIDKLISFYGSQVLNKNVYIKKLSVEIKIENKLLKSN